MKFSEVVKQASALLQDKGQVSYRLLKREFDLDEEGLEDLKAELIEIDGLAVDKDGKMLVWTGVAAPQDTGRQRSKEPESRPAPSAAASQTDRPKLPRPPEGERRQLTVAFIDLV